MCGPASRNIICVYRIINAWPTININQYLMAMRLLCHGDNNNYLMTARLLSWARCSKTWPHIFFFHQYHHGLYVLFVIYDICVQTTVAPSCILCAALKAEVVTVLVLAALSSSVIQLSCHFLFCCYWAECSSLISTALAFFCFALLLNMFFCFLLTKKLQTFKVQDLNGSFIFIVLPILNLRSLYPFIPVHALSFTQGCRDLLATVPNSLCCCCCKCTFVIFVCDSFLQTELWPF